ncbi:hypothetical protein FJT64_024103 [Amphibalanus amphitrite]|uniref:Uncharacterized protein n=1 Tax=Amphibalanus amphitrite TaxID=1232801 RepID=A0A6A4WFI1_AMPAM|nr:hypothetical protein FJT64_024103 [Amphibalanus amphitrite]
MSELSELRLTGAEAGEDGTDPSSERLSVSDLVRSYDDSHSSDGQKRDRSESGDAAPANKRGARDRDGVPARSPLTAKDRTVKETMEIAFDDLETRLTRSLQRDLYEFRTSLSEEIERLCDRVKDLERQDRDCTIAQLSDDLQQSREQVAALQARAEDAEINSRLPCLVLSGAAMAPRNSARLEPHPAAASGGAHFAAPADPARGPAGVTSQPAGQPAAEERAEGAPGSAGSGRGRRDGSWEENINALVIDTLNRNMPGLNISEDQIDRAHRLPGPNNRVIVRFVRSGQGSARDRVWTRRLELRGRELFISESLTRLRSLIFRSLLAAKREKRIYTVFSRGGQVLFKDKQHGVSTRVDSLDKVRELGFTVLER